MLSGDRRVLEENSDAALRLRLQREAVDGLDVFVWPQVHSWWHIWRQALRGHYDIITAQDPFFRGIFAWKLTWFTRAKLNVQVHADLDGVAWYRRIIARFVLRRADSVRVVSDRVAEQVRQMRVKASIHVLPIFVDLERFRMLAREAHEGHVILWIGRLETEKNPGEALDVLRAVRECVHDARLIMLGEGSQLEQLREKSHGLPVTFAGWGDPVAYLPQVDVVLSTSRHESWGASIVEALAAGVPVVSCDVGVAREAGATVAEEGKLAAATIDVLMTPQRAELRLRSFDRAAWAQAWRETLI